MSDQQFNPLNPLEVDLEIAIEEAYLRDPVKVYQKGLYIEGTMIRQPELKGYGTPDLITWRIDHERYSYSHGAERRKARRYLTIHIVELKRDMLLLDHLLQICRYMRGVSSLVNQTPLGKLFFSIDVIGHLVGKSIDMKSDLCFALDSVAKLYVYTWSLDLEHGIRFNWRFGWKRPNEDAADLSSYVDHLKPTAYRKQYKDLIEHDWQGQPMSSNEQP